VYFCLKICIQTPISSLRHDAGDAAAFCQEPPCNPRALALQYGIPHERKQK